MAKSGSWERVDPASLAKVKELKNELLSIVKLIIEEDVCRMENLEKASQVLSHLKATISGLSTKDLPTFRDEVSFDFQQQPLTASPTQFQDRPPTSPSKILHQPSSPLPKIQDESAKSPPLKSHPSATSPSRVPISDSVPEDFLCPISGQIMKDPVILSSGVTFDRLYVQAKLSMNSRICPATNEILEHSCAIPNLFARKVIGNWCKDHGIELQLDHVNAAYPGKVVAPQEQVRVDELFRAISSGSIAEQGAAIKELRILSKKVPGIRAMLADYPRAVAGLTSLLKDCKPGSEVQDNVVATILNFSILDENKNIVGEEPNSIPCLIGAVRNGSMQSRANAAAALFTLADLDLNKAKIGKCDMQAFEALGGLLLDGDAIAKKDAAQAIFLLCWLHENRVRAVEQGALRAILEILKDGQLVDELLSIVALLSHAAEATEVLIDHNRVPEFLWLLKDCKSSVKQENLAIILFSICKKDQESLQQVRAHEVENGTLTNLASQGNARARKKAAAILEKLKRNSDNPTNFFSTSSSSSSASSL